MQQIDPKTLTNVVVMETSEFEIFVADRETLIDDLLSIAPTHEEQVSATVPFDLVHICDDVYLARGQLADKVMAERSCPQCSMNPFKCASASRSMPCLPKAKIGSEGYTAIRAQVQTVAMPTNGKKGKKEYVPDTAASFDFSDQNWKSVRSMIGM
jgi:hypothetical protein